MTSCGLFDTHYLTIDTDYRVVMSTNLQELADTPYYTSLNGRKLRLLAAIELYPRQVLLEKHREVFKG